MNVKQHVSYNQRINGWIDTIWPYIGYRWLYKLNLYSWPYSIFPSLPNTLWGGMWTPKTYPKDLSPEQVFGRLGILFETTCCKRKINFSSHPRQQFGAVGLRCCVCCIVICWIHRPWGWCQLDDDEPNLHWEMVGNHQKPQTLNGAMVYLPTWNGENFYGKFI